MGRAPQTPFEKDLAAFFGEAAPDESRTPLRDHVTFRAADPTAGPLEAADDLVRHIRAQNKGRARGARITARTHTAYSGAVTVRVAWQGRRFHTIRFQVSDGSGLLASHKVADGRDLSLILHEWLTASDSFSRPVWRTAVEWERREPGRSAPI